MITQIRKQITQIIKPKRVVVAMSGGVDSSVAAALLKKAGFEVIGVTMCFNLPDSIAKKPSCCGLQGIEDAKRVAHKLGIRHYVLNLQKALEEQVIKDFCQEYLHGRTPNPCVRCNQYLKFGVLLKKALALDADYLATGHYARIEKSQKSPAKSTKSQAGSRPQPQGMWREKFKIQKYFLKKAKDKKKDQSYFLYRLNQGQLRHTLFPLGNYTKESVRELAREFNLPVADKLASQEICFLPSTNYREFLKTMIEGKTQPGSIVDTQGNILGEHQGIAFYTIGQREGLGIAKGYPVYITEINAKNNTITLGEKKEALKSEFLLKQAHFILKPIKKKIAARVKIRYNHKEALADVVPLGRKVKVCFHQPQFAVTPGQSTVFYDRDTVLGGGIIDQVLG